MPAAATGSAVSRRTVPRILDLPLPGRGHSFAVRPGGREAVHFSRRPGRFALVLDLAQGARSARRGGGARRAPLLRARRLQPGRAAALRHRERFRRRARRDRRLRRARRLPARGRASSPTASARTRSRCSRTARPSPSPTAASRPTPTCRASSSTCRPWRRRSASWTG